MNIAKVMTLMVSLNGMQVMSSSTGADRNASRAPAASTQASGLSTPAPPANLTQTPALIIQPPAPKIDGPDTYEMAPDIMTIERNHPDLYNCQDKDLLLEKFEGITIPVLDVPRAFEMYIKENNLIGFKVLSELGYDPFEKGTTEINALDILETLERSDERRDMIDFIRDQFSDNWIILGKEAGNVNAMRAKYSDHTSAGLDINIWNFTDGSTLMHQIVIENNTAQFERLIANGAYGDKLNVPWGDVANSDAPEMKLNPVGWTPEMLAVALNRTELVEKMKLSGKFNFDLGHNELTPIMLTMKLPERDRIQMLKVLNCFRLDYSHVVNMKAGLEAFPNSVPHLIRHFVHNVLATAGVSVPGITTAVQLFGPILDLVTIKIAIWKLTPPNLDLLLDISAPYSDNLISTNSVAIWNYLKEIPSTMSADDIDQKFVILLRKGFQINPNSEQFQDFVKGPSLLNFHVLDTVLKRMIDINTTGLDSADIFNENLLITAIKRKNITLIKRILENHETLGLELETSKLVRMPSEKHRAEGYIHYVINEIEESAGNTDLLDIVKRLIEIKSSYMELKAASARKNSHKYNLMDGSTVVETVSYAIYKRPGWTPLMYAVVFRKDALAYELIRMGANLGALGPTGISVNEICTERVTAFQAAYARLITTAPSIPLDPAEKMNFILDMTKFLVNKFKKSLEDNLRI